MRKLVVAVALVGGALVGAILTAWLEDRHILSKGQARLCTALFVQMSLVLGIILTKKLG